MDNKYAQLAVSNTVELLGIDSPTGFTSRAADFVTAKFSALGYKAERTVKGGVLIDLGGKNEAKGLFLEAHTDTLGGMVCEVKSNGRLRIVNIGGMQANNGEAENVRVYTRSSKVIEGTLQLCNASVHINGDYSTASRTFDTTEVVLGQ